MSGRAQVPELPYKCEDEGHRCHEEPRLSDLDFTVQFQMGEHTFTAYIREDGLLVDVLRDRDLVSLVRQVHEQYPFARS